MEMSYTRNTDCIFSAHQSKNLIPH